MKLLAVSLLCLSAFVSLSSCQYSMSRVFIQQRAQIMAANCRWYQRLDASYFELYDRLRNTLEGIYRPYKPAYKDLNDAFANLSLTNLSKDTAKNFTDFITNVNQTLFFPADYGARITLMQFSMMLMGPDNLTPPASSLKSAIMMPLSQLFNSFIMSMTPPSDACIYKVLSQFVPTYEPYAKTYLNLASQGIAAMPTLFANATMSSKNAIVEIRSLVNKMKKCAMSPSKQICVNQINQQYAICEDPQQCKFIENITLPMQMVQIAAMELQQMYQLMMMFPWSMELNDKVTALKNSC